MATNAEQEADPAGIVNKLVNLHSISAKPELNGKVGRVLSYNSSRDRYNVQVSSQTAAISLRSSNLSKLSLPQRVQFHTNEFKSMYGPILTILANKIYSSVEDKLPPSIQPKHAFTLLAVLFAYVTWQIGLTKVFMILSLIMMIPVVCLQDLVDAGRYENIFDVLVRKFPFRFRESIVQMTGYRKLTNKMAMGIYIIICLVCGKVVMTPAKPRVQFPSDAEQHATSIRNTEEMQESVPVRSQDSWTMDQIYRMGFEDASDEKEYGASLPPNHEAIKFSSDYASFDRQYMNEGFHEAPPATKSRFGMGSMMSLFALGRAVKDLGYDSMNNRFDLNLFISNAKHMEKWKMLMMGVCLYRVVSAFL